MMFAHADLGLYDSSGRLAAVFAIKNKRGTSREWAAHTRRNFLAHGGSCNAEFFFLVTPDRLYLWKDAADEPVGFLPSYTDDIQSEFARYFERAGVDPTDVSGYAFELTVVAWLSDLIQSDGTIETLGDQQRWLADSGFDTAVKDGHIEFDAVA